MENEITKRIEALRLQMSSQKIAAFIIPSTDPHISEYVAPRWKSRAWISGFTGSAGTVVVTTTEAGLFTDSRYFLQAEQQLAGSGIALFKEGLPDTPSITEWLLQVIPEGETIAVEGAVFAATEAQQLEKFFTAHGRNFCATFSPFDTIWGNRPAAPQDSVYLHPESFSGASLQEKVAQVLTAAKSEGADTVLLAALDEIAWALNLRGTDVECNPVAVCYALLSEQGSVLFIDPSKVEGEVAQYFADNGVALVNYDKVNSYVSQLSGHKILVDTNKANLSLVLAVPAASRIVASSPVAMLKAVKNDTQIAGVRNAMERDGVALVRFFRWLEAHVGSGNVTEMDVADMLIEFRSQQAYYVGESFDTIAGYNPHGAIVHYRADEESNATLAEDGFLLIDSGAQYFDGTTDITRTVALGELSAQQKSDYTRVLKGHIAIATCRYPQGTRGAQIDVLARKALWEVGLNYLHGTGHGVGHFLNVHEGPQSIRLNENPTPLVPGMITSNEPGLYRSNEYGIRLENLVLTQPDIATEFGQFYSFETLTLFPFDKKAIDTALLTPEEVAWVDSYHQMVYDRLSDKLTPEESAWLQLATAKLDK